MSERREGAQYRDRADAGRVLAKALMAYRGTGPAVIGIPRGGIPVAFEVARTLEVPLELWMARRLPAPLHPYHAIGAIAEGGARYVDWEEAEKLGASFEYVEELSRDLKMELEGRVQRFRGGRPPPELQGRTVIVVDDGVATGRTVKAVLQGVRKKRPAKVILAVPVAARHTLRALAPLVDEVVCPQLEREVFALDEFYEEHRAPSDDAILDLLRLAHREPERHAHP